MLNEGLMMNLTYVAAVREALREEMRRDETVILLGEDIGIYGGAYKATKGLLDEFGLERVRDTPISENTIVGAAIGAAITGMKPVIEIMYMDFLNLCGDQLINHAAKIHFMSGGKLKVPLVIRSAFNTGRSTAAQHSQFFPSTFMNVPGLRVVVPSTPYDVKGLLKTAIRDNNPVLFFESVLLYGMNGIVPEEEYLIPFGKADIKREGNDITVLAFSNMVSKTLTAAEILQNDGISIEVIDPRTLVPLDKQTIINSVKKTGKLVVVEEDCKSSSVGAEIVAIVVDAAFDYLDAPILRLAAPDIPAPFAPNLLDLYVPSISTIVQTVKELF